MGQEKDSRTGSERSNTLDQPCPWKAWGSLRSKLWFGSLISNKDCQSLSVHLMLKVYGDLVLIKQLCISPHQRWWLLITELLLAGEKWETGRLVWRTQTQPENLSLHQLPLVPKPHVLLGSFTNRSPQLDVVILLGVPKAPCTLVDHDFVRSGGEWLGARRVAFGARLSGFRLGLLTSTVSTGLLLSPHVSVPLFPPLDSLA